MTAEDDFQRALDTNPGDWQTRLVFADWLQERGDSRAEGYRVLGQLRRLPTSAFKKTDDRTPWHLWVVEDKVESLISTFGRKATTLRKAALPRDWCQAIFEANEKAHLNFSGGWCGYADTRREADDAAALAFAALPADRRAELLATEFVARQPPARKRALKKPRQPATKKAKGKGKK